MTDVARPRILVAGIGNVLRGDDGFGPAVVQALLARGALPAGVHAVELGIGGVGLVHELMDGYDAVVIVDAVDRGGALWVMGALPLAHGVAAAIWLLVTDIAYALAVTVIVSMAHGIEPIGTLGWGGYHAAVTPDADVRHP